VASPAEVSPPNGQLVTIAVVGVADPDGDPVTLTVTGITQDEPLGETCPDATGVGAGTASVRAERAGGGDGRVYHVSFTASDGHGGQCSGMVTVCVPHDQRSGHVCVDKGPLIDSTGTACAEDTDENDDDHGGEHDDHVEHDQPDHATVRATTATSQGAPRTNA